MDKKKQVARIAFLLEQMDEQQCTDDMGVEKFNIPRDEYNEYPSWQ